MDIIGEIVSALKNQEQVVLATVISSSGSTPLPPGASMIVRQRGKIVQGTIGGGVLEASVTKEAEQFSTQNAGSVIRRFELNEGGPGEGMICGGNVDVLIEQIGGEELQVFSKLQDLRIEGRHCILLRHIGSGGKTTKRWVIEDITDNLLQYPALVGPLKELAIPPDRFMQTLQQALRQEAVKRVAGINGEMIAEPIIGIQPVIIFGAGHIGRCLSKIAAASGFAVTIVDDREEYADPSVFPEASRVLAVNFGEAFESLKIRASTSIVIVTRGHDSDREVLRCAVTTPARYIGMIGSNKKVASTYARLREQGVPLSRLKRVHAPIGLDIGAITAEEIAVSIVAELIRARRGIEDPSAPMSGRMDQWFHLAGE
ncbi:MAG: XdhC family protein [Ignavibacteria bacterium]|nr:XdhC family protein [Ignavibacteria bacterium]